MKDSLLHSFDVLSSVTTNDRIIQIICWFLESDKLISKLKRATSKRESLAVVSMGKEEGVLKSGQAHSLSEHPQMT